MIGLLIPLEMCQKKKKKVTSEILKLPRPCELDGSRVSQGALPHLFEENSHTPERDFCHQYESPAARPPLAGAGPASCRHVRTACAASPSTSSARGRCRTQRPASMARGGDEATRLLQQQPPEIHLANVFVLSKTHRIAWNGTDLRQVPIKRWVRRGASWFPSYLVQHYQLLLRGISVLARPRGMLCEHSRHLAVQTHSLLSVFR